MRRTKKIGSESNDMMVQWHGESHLEVISGSPGVTGGKELIFGVLGRGVFSCCRGFGCRIYSRSRAFDNWYSIYQSQSHLFLTIGLISFPLTVGPCESKDACRRKK